MNKSNILDRELNIYEFEKLILELESVLKKESFIQQDCYEEWKQKFTPIYGNKNVNIRLYTILAQIFYIAHLFIFHLLLKEHVKKKDTQSNLSLLKAIQEDILNEFSTDISFLNGYFLPLFEFMDQKNSAILNKLTDYTLNYLLEEKFKPEFLFDYLIQHSLKPLLRHASGEFYTPPFLVKKMVKESYDFGERVLDPSCGTGNFIIELIKSILSTTKSEEEKTRALSNIYGFDINPISILITMVNVIYLIGDRMSEFKSHFVITDSLFHEINLEKEKFDLIIGNPPWYTFRDINSITYQNKIKILAEALEIKPLPKNVLNIEISTLFFYKANVSFMKQNAKIFFVITKGVISGSHTSRFRHFKGFKDVKIWFFNKKIEHIFNIDFICLYAHKNNSLAVNPDYHIPSVYFGLKILLDKFEYFDDIELRTVKKEILIPYSIVNKNKKTYVNKLISLQNYKKLIRIESSEYKSLFHKGADLNPRNLIFITFKPKNESLAVINPDERVFKRAKVPWNKKIFQNSVIEKEYIFKVVKSTELVKFHIYDFYYVFLPISKENHDFSYSNLKNNARTFYEKIDEYYIKNKKITTKHKSFMENLDRWSKLINDRQFSKIKVVYNNSGSNLSSAVIQGDYLITGDLSFYATENLTEAFYLSAILNSNLINEQIKIKKSSRHIFKIPFENPIQKFDKANEFHQKLAQLGRDGEKVAINLITSLLSKNKIRISRNKVQKLLIQELKPILIQIDEYLKPQFLT